MRTSIKPVTRESFHLAVNAAARAKEEYKATRLAHFAAKFLTLNKEVRKKHEKKYNALTEQLVAELDAVMVNNAVQKVVEGVSRLDLTKENAYQYDRDGELAVKAKRKEVGKKIEDIIEPLMAEQVEVRCFLDPIELPENMDGDIEEVLNGFAFTNVSKFEEAVVVSDASTNETQQDSKGSDSKAEA